MQRGLNEIAKVSKQQQEDSKQLLGTIVENMHSVANNCT